MQLTRRRLELITDNGSAMEFVRVLGYGLIIVFLMWPVEMTPQRVVMSLIMLIKGFEFPRIIVLFRNQWRG